MKKLALVICMLIASAVALYAEEGNESRRFEVSGTAYAPIGESSEFLGEVTFASDLSDLVGLSVDGLVSHLSDDDPTWGASLNVYVEPKVADRFYIIPSMGLGVYGGDWWTYNDAVRFGGNMAVALRYEVNESLFCGLKVKAIFCKHDMNAMLVGVNIGMHF